LEFLKANHICSERRQIEDLYKQMLIVRKDEPLPKIGAISKALFMRLFEKPLLLLPMETALSMIGDIPLETETQTLAVVEF